MAVHYTIALTTQAAGMYSIPGKGIYGAPPPFIIVAVTSADSGEGENVNEQEMDDIIEVPCSVQSGFINTDNFSPTNKHAMNPYGFGLRVTQSGSILKSLFSDLMAHLVNNLPPGQGKDGKFAFGLFDYHGSRANPKAMMWAITNGFFPMIMPSKTSIYAQPNDTSANMALSVKVSETSVEMHLCSLSTPSLHDYNTLMANSLIKFIDEENDKVIRTVENCATSGMAKTGLYPSNYDCSS